MPYPVELVQPMREELIHNGFQELLTPDEVDDALTQKDETVLLLVNSVCGCAAGQARPAVIRATQHDKRPGKLTTVFAGQDLEATEKARDYLHGYRPSSPSIALLKEGELVFMLERSDIESNPAEIIAERLTEAFDKFCG